MGTFLLLLFIFFVVVPILKAVYHGWKLRSQFKDAARSFRETYNQTQHNQNTASTEPKSQKKKKIDANVGEYVAFEEISCDVRRDEDNVEQPKTYPQESQVEDAVWEDIKEE